MEDLGIYMNLMTDFGFKRLFGSEEHKNILIRFLNILFADEGMHVSDVTFHDKEVLPSDKDGKRIVYDVYCTTKNKDEHIIIEMQQVYHPAFESRAAYYAAKAISEQVRKGGSYDFRPLYAIFFVNFHFHHMRRSDIHDVRLIDTKSHEIFSDRLRLLFLHLTEAKRDWESCTTEYDKILFIIKNMHTMDKQSKAYRSGEFDDVFNAAEIGNLVAEDIVAYSESKLKYDETMSAIEYSARKSYAEGEQKGREEGREEGRVKGREEGREEGMQLEKLATARKLLEAGMTFDFIRSITGLSEEDLN